MRDPYAAAAERARLAPARAQPDGLLGDLPVGPPRRNVVRRALVLAGIVVLGGYVASGVDDPPATPANCEATTMVLGKDTLDGGGAIRYTFTGPKNVAYVVAVDASAVQVDGDRITVTPRADTIGGALLPHSKVIRPTECLGRGTLSVDQTVGTRHVTLFSVDSAGRGTAATEQTVEVLEP